MQWTKVSLDYSIPQQTFQTIPFSLNLENPPPLPPPLPFLKGSMFYTILNNINYLKYSWLQLISFSISHILCVHPETTATLLFFLKVYLQILISQGIKHE